MNGRISSSCMSFGSQKLLSSWTRLTIRLVSDWLRCGGEKSVILPLHLFILLSLLKPLDLVWTMSWSGQEKRTWQILRKECGAIK